MSGAFVTAAGAVLLVVMFVDLVWTTLGVSYGSGPLTRVVLGLGWRAASPLRRRRAHSWQAAAGVTTVLATLVLWVVLLWAAWSLIFLGPSRGIVDGASAAAGGVGTVSISRATRCSRWGTASSGPRALCGRC